MGKPYLPNIEPIIAAGINPKTGLPYKLGSDKCLLKDEIKKFLRKKDRQDAVNRYKWNDFPANLNSQDVERMLYYKGQLCLFYDEKLEDFYLMPYALDGTIDFYGRYNQVHPVPMTSGKDEENTERYKTQASLLSMKKLKPVYTLEQAKKVENPNECCVILRDFTNGLPQVEIPMANINEPILDTMAEMIPFMRTSCIIGTGISGVRVNDADQQESVTEGAKSLETAALSGMPWVGIVGNIEFQELTGGQLAKAEEYMSALQSLDNFRLSGYGINNGGVFEKKAHELQSESDENKSASQLAMEDGLILRQIACDIANQLWGINMSVNSNDEALGEEEEEEAVEEESYDDTTI